MKASLFSGCKLFRSLWLYDRGWSCYLFFTFLEDLILSERNAFHYKYFCHTLSDFSEDEHLFFFMLLDHFSIMPHIIREKKNVLGKRKDVVLKCSEGNEIVLSASGRC